jgi:hypothetical protein
MDNQISRSRVNSEVIKNASGHSISVVNTAGVPGAHLSLYAPLIAKVPTFQSLTLFVAKAL